MFPSYSTRLVCSLLFLAGCFGALAQTQPYSVRMANRVMALHPDSIITKAGQPARWDYEQGLVLKALERVWERTADVRYYDYILHDMNRYVGPDGSIRTYRADEYNVDNLPGGRVLLMLAQQSEADREKYRKAVDILRAQLTHHPRTREGGFWHKQRYPNQMWLDGLYMAEPFYAEYAAIYPRSNGSASATFDDVAHQFDLIEKYLVDPKTGLLVHGYDESRQQKWADPKTGQSPNVWGRSVGWYAMALVDVLDYFPASHPKRATLISYLQRLMPAVVRYQDKGSGCWYEVMDQGSRKGNYVEASASCMFVYALAKGVRMGYLPAAMQANAKRGYDGILKKFIETSADGTIDLNGTVSVGGLGGTASADRSYRDGSYDYYLSEPIKKNDLKGVGPFIMASVEMEMVNELGIGGGKTVGLDYYFNHEFRKGDTGDSEQGAPARFHYTWEDRMHSGFWLWGNTFRELGAKTVSIPAAPTAQTLKDIDVYVIVDPDTPKETAAPNYVRKPDIDAIETWVKAGGVLVLMANDTINCEIPHFNELAKRFGLRFLDEQVNHVVGTQWEGGKLTIPPNHPIFATTQTIYIKELAPLALTPPAQPLLTDGKNVIMAVAKVGKGTVFALGDPWLYNEYTDGRHIPGLYQNFRAGKELASWLLRQSPKK